MIMNMSFKDKTVFITGASRGIGKCIKQSFLDEGANVISPGREELDLSNPASVQDYIDCNKNVKADILVHCAGINILSGIEEITADIMNEVYQVNVVSATQLMKHFTTGMKASQSGKVILISSLYATVSRERRIAYSASKSALLGLMKSTALELAPSNVLVNCVAPGYVMTEMTRHNLSDEDIKGIEENIPTGRFQSEQEIADLVLFLASDRNKSITGQLISVDGGFLCK